MKKGFSSTLAHFYPKDDEMVFSNFDIESFSISPRLFSLAQSLGVFSVAPFVSARPRERERGAERIYVGLVSMYNATSAPILTIEISVYTRECDDLRHEEEAVKSFSR